MRCSSFVVPGAAPSGCPRGGQPGPMAPGQGRRACLRHGADEEVAGPSTLLDMRSEQEFVLRIKKEVERGKLPPDVADNFENLYYNYKNAVLQNGDPNAYRIMLSNMMDLFDRDLLDADVLFLCLSPSQFALKFSLCSKMHLLHKSSCSFAESIYVSALSQGHQRTI
ncbi:glycerol-3-phosphate acyltransferase, chloroplastic-like [Triticum aestivum]|uniref:glycerol-3-phosphate acyltransferase, chloroplastic-like n=1 Tax=Triticum aestivum TaxID=4565 RepID=UPI001D031AF2|nr:glycerol-3-phosphate acyltransferase, chloroplastic-like [Triticum aestivum]